ncbi:MAG: hybrid sensor histidine kinase/response regulator [Opitutaceae bacterium]|nr:hybrid sensor histidine kinase/response regulator [Opitutaceae bacterium]
MLAKSKILIIDDEEVVLDSCTQVLAGADCVVATAGNGVQGLKLMEETTPDLVFLDLKMPGLSGFEVLGEIRGRHPDMVVIVITGYATVSSAVEAMKKGAFDFLPKPFTPEELRLIFRRGLEHHSLVQQTVALRREKEMLRENFAAIVSHELKAPLGAIQQNLYALTEDLADKLSDSQRDLFGRLKIRLDDLLKLIHSWLRIISVDVNQLKGTFSPLSVADVLSKAIETTQPHATRKAIEIQAIVGEPLPRVNGDEGSLTEVLVNIIGNAVKYSFPHSKIRVRVEAQGAQVLLSVADTGVGIAKDDLPFLFQDFVRGQAQPGGATGCGLGLAISRRIVEVHDGSITVESEPGKGSTFVICLPAVPPATESNPIPERKA